MKRLFVTFARNTVFANIVLVLIFLAGAIIRLLRNPAEANCLAKNAFHSVSEIYSSQKMADAYMKLYAELIYDKEATNGPDFHAQTSFRNHKNGCFCDVRNGGIHKFLQSFRHGFH